MIRVTDSEAGTFEVLQRGGNVSIKLILEAGVIQPVLEQVASGLQRLRATIDGQLERAAVLTVPFTGSLSEIEEELAGWCARHPGLIWYYGDVYDADGRPLGWWEGHGG